MKFFAVCTRPRYDHTHVERLVEQLHQHYSGDIDFTVYTDRPDSFGDIHAVAIEHTLCERQWYKVDFAGHMNIDLNEPIIVMDIDLTIIRNIDHIIDMPVQPHQFAAIERWWRAPNQPMNINGGMYKYYPSTCQHIFQKFYSAPKHWQNNYRQYSRNQVTGEQYFMWESVRDTHEIITFPADAFVPVRSGIPETIPVYNRTYTNLFGKVYIDSTGTYDQSVCILHG
jgi:hypothetical protein